MDIDISDKRPKALTLEMAGQANKGITMGCDLEEICPASFVEAEDWELEDLKSRTLAGVRKIRDEIRVKVVGLLHELQQNKDDEGI